MSGRQPYFYLCDPASSPNGGEVGPMIGPIAGISATAELIVIAFAPPGEHCSDQAIQAAEAWAKQTGWFIRSPGFLEVSLTKERSLPCGSHNYRCWEVMFVTQEYFDQHQRSFLTKRLLT